jgi:cysteine desulfurase family protein (TIGR01976 family)
MAVDQSRAGLAQAVASVDAIRARFPALARTHGGHPVAYFDGPGGTQVPREVVDAMADYLLHHNANTHWHYPSSEETDRLIGEAREAVADFLNGAAAEVAFGANMTTLTFHLARALGRGWGSGDEIVVTELDHHANVAPWRALEKERGVRVRAVPFRPETGQLDWPALERALGPRTRLLAIGGASNALGTVNDVAAAARLARNVGALTFMDAVHYAPHALADVQALGVDFLACSAYKFYGPHVGILWGRGELLEALDVPKLEPAPSWIPDKLETGTQNHEGIAGVRAAVDFFASLAPAGGSRRQRLGAALGALHRRGEELLRRLWDGLARMPGVRCFGPPPGQPRTPTVAFAVEGRTSTAVARACAAQGVFVSNGDFYATTVLERLGYAKDGLVRAGCACYTTAEEVERLVEAVGT